MSSPTIVPADFQCCGPFGSARYYKVTISGIGGSCPQCVTNCDCSSLNGDYYFDMLLDSTGSCQATLSLDPSICRYGLLTFGILLCPDSASRVSFILSLVGTALSPPGTSIVWRKDNIQNCLDPQSLPFLSQVGSECTASGSVTVEPIAPASMKAIFDTCFACPNCDASIQNVPQVWAPQADGFVPGCCPRCDAMQAWAAASSANSLIPSPGFQGGSCGGSSCNVRHNAEHGNAMIQFGPPEGDPWSPIPIFTLNTTYGLGSPDFFGQRVSSVLNQAVIDGNSLMAESKTVIKCDGSRETHTCKPPGPGSYLPPPNSPNVLTLNADGTYTERCGDGYVYDYGTDGLINRITNPSGKIWTLILGSPVRYIVDPASRRTTLSYDSMTGKLRRFQDPFGRLTTFTLDSGNRLTQFITPELCTTEFRYHSVDDRLKAIISPEGLRTSFAYTADGLCSEIREPSGGVYAYEYQSWQRTKVTAPNSTVTTLTHNISRQVLSVTEPSGLRTSYTYEGRRLLSVQPASGARTSLVYSTLSNGTYGLTQVDTLQGSSVFAYDSNSRLKTTIDPLGRRTTLAYNGSGLQVAQTNALGQRTTYVYNGNGQRAAEVDGLGQRTTYSYDATGNRLAQINPLSYRTTYSYSKGQVTRTTSPIGAITTMVYDNNNRKQAQVDPLGNRTSFLYESCSLPKAVIRPSGTRTTNVYSFGRLAASIDPLNNRTSFTYDSLGRQIRTTSPMGRISTTIYNSDGQRQASIDPSGLRTTTVYDSAGRPKSTIAPSGTRTTTVYDASSRTVAMIAADSTRTSFAYDANNNQIRQQSPSGALTTSVYDKLNRAVATIDPFNKRTTTVYDAAGNTQAMVNALGQRSTMLYDAGNQNIATVSPLGRRNSYVYDPAGRQSAMLDGKGNRWTSVYDLASRQVASQDPLLRRTTTVYNVDSLAVAQVDAAGLRATTVYDAAQRPIARIDRTGARTTTTYNADSQVRSTVDALSYRTSMVYDAGGRQVATIDARSNRVSTVYDSKGRTAASVNALGNRWTTVFDSASRPTASVDPLGNRSTSVYDTYGRLSAGINPLGKRTTSIYDLANRQVGSIDANSHRTTSVYDVVGRQQASVTALGFRTTSVFDADALKVGIIDPRGNRQSFTYDAVGSQTQQIDPLSRRTTYAYDAARQQTLRLDARGNRTSYSYSSTGQLAARKYPDGSRASFSYDTEGRRTLMADSTGRVTTAYDARGQATSVKQPSSQRLTYSYDAVGNRRSLETVGAGRFTYAYQADNQLSSLLNPFSERTTYTYDNAARRSVQRNANGTRTSILYDAASQVTQQHSRTSTGTAITTFDYKYDNVGNRTGVLEADGSRVTWAYDNDDRLSAERRSGTSAYAQTFTYDSAGNRTLKNEGAVRTTFSYDNANQLRYSQAASGRTTYAYDATGNQQIEQPPSGNRTTTTWDYENRPVLYKLPDTSRLTLSYNSDSRRMTKASASSTSKFVWDPVTDAYLQELDGSNILQATYTQEPAQFGRLVSQRRSSNSSFFHDDALGSTRALTGSSQSTSDTYLYDAWGNQITSSGITVNPFRWVGNVGYYYDSETSLFYIRARTYQPTTARWTSVDPLFAMLALQAGFSSGESIGYNGNGYNLLQYGNGNPLGYFDPSGLMCLVCKWYRHTGKEQVALLDTVFTSATPYNNFALAMFNARNAKIRGYKLEYRYDASLTTGPIQATRLPGHDGNTIDNGVLFYLAADVCETNPGDCRVDFAETELWQAEARSAGGPYFLIKPGTGTNFRGRTPVGIGNPSINDLDPRVYSGKCNRRIVLGDFAANISTLKPPSFKAWGALQSIRIYDKEGNQSQMRHRFGIWTKSTATYDIGKFITRGSSDSVAGNGDRCC